MSEWISCIFCLCKSQDPSEISLCFKRKIKSIYPSVKLTVVFFSGKLTYSTRLPPRMPANFLMWEKCTHPCIPALGHQVCWLYSHVPWYLDQKPSWQLGPPASFRRHYKLLPKPVGAFSSEIHTCFLDSYLIVSGFSPVSYWERLMAILPNGTTALSSLCAPLSYWLWVGPFYSFLFFQICAHSLGCFEFKIIILFIGLYIPLYA